MSDKRMSAERLAEWEADIDECMDWVTTPDIRELLQALKAEREKVEELEESLHYTSGCCDLAMKHRDIAESRIEAVNASWLKDINAFYASLKKYGYETSNDLIDRNIELEARLAKLEALQRVGVRVRVDDEGNTTTESYVDADELDEALKGCVSDE